MITRQNRRAFLRRVLTAGALLGTSGAAAARPPFGSGASGSAADSGTRAGRFSRQSAGVGALDHVAVPMQNVEAMVAFYRAFGFVVREGPQVVSVHFGDQKINFHRPALWQRETFTLRAAAARPPCGDFCWVWEGSESALRDTVARVGAQIVAEGTRDGGRDGGDAVGQSLYVRDPDGNLLEFIRYG